MTRKGREAGPLIAALVALWAAVAMRGWWLCGGVPALASMAHAGDPATSGAPNDAAIATLRHRRLRLPIDNAAVERLEGMFARTRDGNPPHEAVDIVAPRDTPIHAVEDGTIARLFTSNAGGLTIYQFDPDQRFSYYYAHLERYAPGLAEGQRVMRGDVIGFVGTSGNAPSDTPHLHFAIFELEAERQWWSGRPIDPYRVFK